MGNQIMNSVKLANIKTSPLAFKLLLVILLSSSLVTLIITAIQLTLQYNSDVQHIENRILQVKVSYLDPIKNSLWNFNETQYKIQLEGILNLEDVVYVELRGPKGKKITSQGQYQQQKTIQKQFPLQVDNFGKAVDIGKLVIIASLNRIYEDLLNQGLIILLSQGIKTLLISTVIIFAFYFLVTRHLWFISDYTKKINSKSDSVLLLDRTENREEDELDTVVNALTE